MQNFFIYLSNYSRGAARGPHHRSAPENFFIYLYVGPDIRVGNATMGGDCPGISLFISTVRSDGLRCRALRMTTNARIRVSPTGFKASRQGSRFYLPLVLGPAWVTGVGRAVW